MPPLPNLYIVGAEKAGTTSLYHYLRDHPEVFMSDAKEPAFFFYLARDGPDAVDEAAYRAHFEGAEDYPVRGEATTNYLYEEAVPELIHERVPDARIVISLRDPIQRAYSNYWRGVAGGVVREAFGEVLGFDEVVRRELAAMEAGEDRIGYVDRSLYADPIERYFEAFGRDQVHVMLLDDLKADAEGAVRELLAFLDVDPGEATRLDTSSRQNTFHGVPYGGLVERVRTSPVVKGLAKRVLPQGVRDWLGNQVLLKGDEKPPVPHEARRRLAEVFEPDVARVEELIDRELPELRASWPEAAHPGAT